MKPFIIGYNPDKTKRCQLCGNLGRKYVILGNEGVMSICEDCAIVEVI